jgi:hypothetical protein
LKITMDELKKMIDDGLGVNKMLLERPTASKEEAVIAEASFNRARQHVEERGVPFVMISAYRNPEEVPMRQNRANDKAMKRSFNDAGFPFIKMSGGYIEKSDEEEETQVSEPSILVLDAPVEGIAKGPVPDLFQFASEMARKYNQDSFIYGQPKTSAGEITKLTDPRTKQERVDMDIRAYDKEGGVINEPWAGPWNNLQTAGKDDLYWSTISGKKGKLVEMLQKYEKFSPKSKLQAREKQYYLEAVKSALSLLTK